jgi:DNA-binding NarL/FixJ family response regulator
VLVDDETMFRQLMALNLVNYAGVAVVRELGTAAAAYDECVASRPDLLIIDQFLPDGKGRDVAVQLLSLQPSLKVVLLTAHPDEVVPSELLRAGITGYVDKTEPMEHVVRAIQAVLQGGMYFAASVVGKPNRAGAAAESVETGPLSRREIEIARLVAGGEMSKVIADRLGISVRTVEKHRSTIMKKLGVREVASLTRWCIQSGLLD